MTMHDRNTPAATSTATGQHDHAVVAGSITWQTFFKTRVDTDCSADTLTQLLYMDKLCV